MPIVETLEQALLVHDNSEFEYLYLPNMENNIVN
jgi:hypothetical protein